MALATITSTFVPDKRSPRASAQSGVHFHGRESGNPSSEQVGGYPRAGADLQDVIAQVAGGVHPGQQFDFQRPCPFRAGQVPQMVLVHPSLVRYGTYGCPGRRGQQSDEIGQGGSPETYEALPGFWLAPTPSKSAKGSSPAGTTMISTSSNTPSRV